VLLEQLAHVRFAEGNGNSINASFEACSEVLSLEGILCAEFASSFGDCWLSDWDQKSTEDTYFQVAGCPSEPVSGFA
jgi:hypothetical protein